jgi:hypothetical protein
MVSRDYAHLQRIVAEAIYDESFRNRLFNGDRREVIAQFDLTQDEQDVILAIEADTLEGFARELLGWMRQHDRV